MMKPTAGELRAQSAYLASDTKVIVVSDDPQLKDLRVVAFYPDTVDADREWNSCFKIKVARDK